MERGQVQVNRPAVRGRSTSQAETTSPGKNWRFFHFLLMDGDSNAAIQRRHAGRAGFFSKYYDSDGKNPFQLFAGIKGSPRSKRLTAVSDFQAFSQNQVSWLRRGVSLADETRVSCRQDDSPRLHDSTATS